MASNPQCSDATTIFRSTFKACDFAGIRLELQHVLDLAVLCLSDDRRHERVNLRLTIIGARRTAFRKIRTFCLSMNSTPLDHEEDCRGYTHRIHHLLTGPERGVSLLGMWKSIKSWHRSSLARLFHDLKQRHLKYVSPSPSHKL